VNSDENSKKILYLVVFFSANKEKELG
jgi:hypothetical protein